MGKNIHLIESKAATTIIVDQAGNLQFDDTRYLGSYLNVYVTDKIQPQLNDWVLDLEDNTLGIVTDAKDPHNLIVAYRNAGTGLCCAVDGCYESEKFPIQRIVITSDTQLIDQGVQEAPQDFLEWLCKNQESEEVEIVKDVDSNHWRFPYLPYNIVTEKVDSKGGFSTSMGKNIHIIYTTEASRLHDTFNSLRLERCYDFSPRNLNVYVTKNDEDIHDGDFIITTKGILVHVTYLLSPDLEGAAKVVLTSDPALTREGVQLTDDEFLKWLVRNSSCEEVEIKFETLWLNKRFGGTWQPFPDETATVRKKDYKIILPKEEPYTEVQQNSLKVNKEFVKNTDPEQLEKIMSEFDEPKEETLKEAIKEYCLQKYKDNAYYPDIEKAIEFGVKWQQETYTQFTLSMESLKSAREGYLKGKEEYRLLQNKSYSEEEVLLLLEKRTDNVFRTSVSFTDTKEWFKKFKKK